MNIGQLAEAKAGVAAQREIELGVQFARRIVETQIVIPDVFVTEDITPVQNAEMAYGGVGLNICRIKVKPGQA